MPVRHLPSNPSLDHLKYQAKDLLKGHAARDFEVAQRIREFHPSFMGAGDAEIFSAGFGLADAQLAIAREYGFPSWTRLKARVENQHHLINRSCRTMSELRTPCFAGPSIFSIQAIPQVCELT